jgi:hypothetical protein
VTSTFGVHDGFQDVVLQLVQRALHPRIQSVCMHGLPTSDLIARMDAK